MAPEGVQPAFPDLVNATTGRCKREVVRSLAETDKGKAVRETMPLAAETLEWIEAARRLVGEGPAKSATPGQMSP